MSNRTRTAIVAAALGLAALATSGGAFAQSPPRDPNPPARSGEPGHGNQGHDNQAGMHSGDHDDQGRWHHGDNGDQNRWHHGDSGDQNGRHHGMM